MCYPYGDANEPLTRVLRSRGCALGLTTRVAVATSADDPLLLPRLDTNDLPRSDASTPAATARPVSSAVGAQ